MAIGRPKAALVLTPDERQEWESLAPRAFGLQPQRTDTFKLSPDALLIPKVREMVGLYMHPPNHAVVLCVDPENANASAGSHGPVAAAASRRRSRAPHA